jgi:hypothetical protein
MVRASARRTSTKWTRNPLGAFLRGYGPCRPPPQDGRAPSRAPGTRSGAARWLEQPSSSLVAPVAPSSAKASTRGACNRSSGGDPPGASFPPCRGSSRSRLPRGRTCRPLRARPAPTALPWKARIPSAPPFPGSVGSTTPRTGSRPPTRSPSPANPDRNRSGTGSSRPRLRTRSTRRRAARR